MQKIQMFVKDALMSYKYKIFSTIAPFVFFLDQLTKFLILKYVTLGDAIPIIDGFFDIVHVRNTGAAFGMFAHLTNSVRVPFFYAISLLAVVILITVFKELKPTDRFSPYPLSLISAGVLGNLVDRLRFGNVVDFLSFHVRDKAIWGFQLEWPAFNIADSAITISMILLGIHLLRGK